MACFFHVINSSKSCLEWQEKNIFLYPNQKQASVITCISFQPKNKEWFQNKFWHYKCLSKGKSCFIVGFFLQCIYVLFFFHINILCFFQEFILIILYYLFSVSAFYFECPGKQMCMDASIYTKSKFYGMSIGVNLIGKSMLDW